MDIELTIALSSLAVVMLVVEHWGSNYFYKQFIDSKRGVYHVGSISDVR